MATAPEHYQESERCLQEAGCEYGCPHSGCVHEMRLIARAQAHATLAHAAATALRCPANGLPSRDREAWFRAAGTAAPKDAGL